MLADLPTWADAQFLKTSAGALAIGAIVLGLLMLFLVRSAITKVVAVVLLGAAVFGLLHYRQTLETCNRRGCHCSLFGQKVTGGNCTTG